MFLWKVFLCMKYIFCLRFPHSNHTIHCWFVRVLENNPFMSFCTFKDQDLILLIFFYLKILKKITLNIRFFHALNTGSLFITVFVVSIWSRGWRGCRRTMASPWHGVTGLLGQSPHTLGITWSIEGTCRGFESIPELTTALFANIKRWPPNLRFSSFVSQYIQVKSSKLQYKARRSLRSFQI